MEALKNSGALLGPPMKSIGRGRKKIKAENTTGPLLVVPYPILASGAEQSAVSITAKEGKTYRYEFRKLQHDDDFLLQFSCNIAIYVLHAFHLGTKILSQHFNHPVDLWVKHDLGTILAAAKKQQLNNVLLS